MTFLLQQFLNFLEPSPKNSLTYLLPVAATVAVFLGRQEYEIRTASKKEGNKQDILFYLLNAEIEGNQDDQKENQKSLVKYQKLLGETHQASEIQDITEKIRAEKIEHVQKILNDAQQLLTTNSSDPRIREWLNTAQKSLKPDIPSWRVNLLDIKGNELQSAPQFDELPQLCEYNTEDLNKVIREYPQKL